MSEFTARDVSIDDAAAFLGVSVSTIRRRLASKELRRAEDVAGGAHVRFVPLEDWLRLSDAAKLLGIATSTARNAAARGELVGKQEGERWWVKLISVLEDRRCDPRAVALFSGTNPPPPEREEQVGRPAPSFRRDLHVLLPVEDAELLEQLRDRHGREHGSVTLVICEALRRLADSPDSPTRDEVAELRVKHAAAREALQRERQARQEAEGRALIVHGDVMACHECNEFVPADELRWVQIANGDAVLHHGAHKLRQPSRLRGPLGNVLAARPAPTAQ